MAMATNTAEDTANYRHRLPAANTWAAVEVAVVREVHQHQDMASRGSRSRPTGGDEVKGLLYKEQENTTDIANSSLKFKRKRQSTDQNRANFCQSQSAATTTGLLSIVASLATVLLIISARVAPASSAAIAAVTNEPTHLFGLNPTTNSVAGSNPTESASTTGHGTIPSPIIRLPSNSLIKYTAYRDVSILHFQVPRDTRTLFYSFRAHEEFKSAFSGNKCAPRNITLHLKARSYPVISPENIPFPRHFFDENQREKIHTLEFKSNSAEIRLQIDGPLPGSWFGVAFISWTDPKQDRIEQQGLTVSCETVLTSEMSVQGADPEIIMDGSHREHSLRDNQSEPYAYKFYVPTGVEYVRLHFNVLETCPNVCPVVQVAVAADTLPNEDNYLDRFAYWTNITSANQLHFFTMDDVWHYIDVSFAEGESSSSSSSTVNEFRYSLSVEYVYVNDTEEEEEEEGSITSLLPRINFEKHSLMRQTYREFFMYDFDLLPDALNETPQYMNISAASPVHMQFSIGDTYDIGGTLSFAVAFYTTSRSDYGDAIKVPTSEEEREAKGGVPGPVAERLVDDGGEGGAGGGRFYMTLVVCMGVGIVGIPTWPQKCIYGRHAFEPVIVINTTSEATSTGMVHVPYPETGRWSISLGLFCPNESTTAMDESSDLRVVAEEKKLRSFIAQNVHLLDEMIHPRCPCGGQRESLKACITDETRNCLYVQMNSTVLQEIQQCMVSVDCVKNHQNVQKRYDTHDHLYAVKELPSASPVGLFESESCNAKLVFTIASNPCVAGRCGQYGKCYHYMSGGVVYSTCLCNKGYRGWDCTEDSEVPDSWTILWASLLLTLSNLLFIPSIYFGVRRKYYTEAVIYFFAMFFSSFYHACDSGEDEYSFCLVKIGVLQFSDFYCGLLAIWVTLIAMAKLRPGFVSVFHMLGAIILAFGTELNKQSLWVFLTPAVTGLCIITTSWGLRCYRTKKWFPSRKYYSVYLPVGAVLVMIGLSCYAFLQTKQNYHIVHSIWHMVMALSLLCLLPDQKSFIPES